MYHWCHGGDIYGFEKEMLDFSANINPLGLPVPARQVLANCAEACANYPDPHCRELRRLLSLRENIPQERIVCGNGAADIIFRAVAYKKPKTALLPAPTFSEYEAALRGVACEITRYPLFEEKEFMLGDDLPDIIIRSRPEIIFLCNPNNPTGQLTPPGLTERIVKAARQASSMLVVDECFLDFLENSGDLTAKQFFDEGGEILILKALTKFYAMAGLRLGYGLSSSEELAMGVKTSGPQWAVSVPAQLCAVAALADTNYACETLALIGREREYLKTALISMGFLIFGSRANYIFFKSEITDLRERLIDLGILIRSCDNYPGLGVGFYRVAVKSRVDNARLIDGLELILHRAQTETHGE